MNIDDREACTVYADYLLEQGDPLGEVMAAHLCGDSMTQRQLEAAYLEAHFSFLRAPASALDVTWKHGLVDRMSVRTHRGADTIKAIANLPAARFLRELQLAIGRRNQLDPTPGAAMRAFAEYPLPPTLRKLDLEMSLEPTYRSGPRTRPNRWVPVELDALYPQLSALEGLTLGPPVGRLGTMDLPALRSLSLTLEERETALELTHAKLPELETLQLRRSFWSFLEELDIPRAPKLERLALAGSFDELQGDAYLIMSEAPLVRRVRVLELDHVRREDADLLTLVAPQLLHLSELRLHRDQIEETDQADLVRILGSRVVFR